jgi:serine/threonine-protein phosphatase 6 regulatory subunit 3
MSKSRYLSAFSYLSQWLSAEDLMGRLIEMLSPSYPSDVHTVVADIIKNIIAMAAPSPGSGLSEGLQNGPASNRFARELANRNRLVKLAGYMLNDFSTASIWTYQDGSDTDSSFNASEPMTPHTPVLPNAASATSSVAQSIVVVIELIRKNNSDYFEPYLFHNLRNRLMTVQQQFQGSPEDGREAMERVMQEMVGRMRVVHLGSVLEVMCDCLGAFQRYLRDPRSLVLPDFFARFRCPEYTGLYSRKAPLRRPSVRCSHSPSSDIGYANYMLNYCIAPTCLC